MKLWNKMGYDIKELKPWLGEHYGAQKVKEFDRWFGGQTGAIYRGKFLVYKDDLERFLAKKPVID